MINEFHFSAPCLRIERLLLREYRCEDFDVFAAHMGDPVSSAHLSQADRWLRRNHESVRHDRSIRFGFRSS